MRVTPVASEARPVETSTATVRDVLRATARAYNHVLEEHRRAGAESASRRHLRQELDELETRFERLLGRWVPAETVRTSWRGHLHAGAPPPPEPVAPERRLAFKGRSDAGSVASAWRGRDLGDYEVFVDGKPIGRFDRADELAERNGPRTAVFDGIEFREIFDAPAAAVDALGGFVAAEPGIAPPWRWAGELLADGLIDQDFGLTPRGRRRLAHTRSAVRG